MARIKPILPSLRERKRYLAFEIVSKNKIKPFSDVFAVIEANSLKLLGELGVADAGIMFMNKYDESLQRGLVRVNHKHVETLKTVLALTKTIHDQEVIARSIGTSGILKKAEDRYLKEKPRGG